MASASALQTPSRSCQALSDGSTDTGCAFRRSKSRVFYESECTTGTSWEFRGLGECPSPPYQQYQFSVLRSPAMTSAQESPIPYADASSRLLHRSIPSPPVKDDLGGNGSDGSRNSTGSSTGSHRSQDSGFSDSGESRPHRRLSVSATSCKSPGLSGHFSDGQCGKSPYHDPNKNYLASRTQNLNSRSRNSSTCATQGDPFSSSIYYIPVHQYADERCSSTTVPSPIPHSGSGCGRLFVKSCGTSQAAPKPLVHTSDSRRYQNEISHTSRNAECVNCTYHDGLHFPPHANVYEQSGVSHGLPSGALENESNNYVIYGTNGENGSHYGVPVSSSTPKRSNLSSAKTSVMQKIDNFESLNKNKKLLDSNNNNSSNRCSPTPVSCSGFVAAKAELIGRTLSGTTLKSKTTKRYRLSFPSLISSSTIVQSLSRTSQGEDPGTQIAVYRAPLPLPSVSGSETQCGASELLTEYEDVNKNLAVPHTPKHTSHVELKTESCFTNSRQEKFQNEQSHLPETPKSSHPQDTYTVAPKLDISTTSRKSHFKNDSLSVWVHELRSQVENECFYVLQTKCFPSPSEEESLPSGSDKSLQMANSQGFRKNSRQKSSDIVQSVYAVSAPLMSVRNVEKMANVVSAEFAKICKHIEFGMFAQVPNLVLALVANVEEFLRTFQCSGDFGNLQKLEHKLAKSCRRLHRSSVQMIEIMGEKESMHNEARSLYSIIENSDSTKEDYHVAVSKLVDGIVNVGNLFSQVVDLRLTRDFSCILDTIEAGGVPARVALKSFATILIDGGNHLCRLAAEIRTVRGLLGVILDTSDEYLRILSLRCLATILCVGEALKAFDQASGFEIVADFMYEKTYAFELKLEAVSVLAQATDPWIEVETSLSSLKMHLEKIIIALTNLVPSCRASEEFFLLLVATISNLTFLEQPSIRLLRRYGTISIIIDALEKANYKFSVFVLDHVATILANSAGDEMCRPDIIQSGGIKALLRFLNQGPASSNGVAAEIMACERVQQKSTIAISRLCTEEGVAQTIFQNGGVHRLIVLSRNDRERNYSDGVLIAALATLRKLVGICGDEAVKGLQADDLIQPRLLDSFLLYSSRQESYV